VYALIRFNFLLTEVLHLLCILSISTIFIRGLRANIETDFKKIIAISTLSQLGFIIFTLSLGYWALTFFHVLFHAFFKSSLFLSTGSLIHEKYRIQDSRFYGNFQRSFYSKVFFISSCIRLIGLPFTLGFFSKDTILRKIASLNRNSFFLLFLISCCLTISYSFRIIFLSFRKNTNTINSLKNKEELIFITPVLTLNFLRVFTGIGFFTEFFFTEFSSLLDCCLGLLLISAGYFINKIKIKNHYYDFFLSISFLASLITNKINTNNKILPFKTESS